MLTTVGAAAPASAVAPAASATARRIDRLVHLARLWGTVRYFHPYVAYRDLDLDGALTAAIDRTYASDEDFAGTVRAFLGTLHDPVTRLADPPAKPSPQPDRPLRQTLDGGALLVDVAAARSPAQLFPLMKELPAVTTIVFDLRGEAQQAEAIASRASILCTPLVAHDVFAPAQRTLRHVGYRPRYGFGEHLYSSRFETHAASFPAPPDARPHQLAFIVGKDGVVPPLAVALQRAGDAVIVAEGTPAPLAPETVDVDLGEGLHARVRTGELVDDDKVHPDRLVASGKPASAAVQTALALLAKPRAPRPPSPVPAPPSRVQLDRAYPDLSFPPRAYRLLALYRVWAMVSWFYPYRGLIGEDWDQVLAQLIPRFESAHDARDYALAIAELSTHVPDGHSLVSHCPELEAYLGAYPTVIELRLIEGAPVVTSLRDVEAARQANVEIGDVVVSVDGEPAAARRERLGRLLAAATPAGHDARVMALFLNGADGATHAVTLRDRQGHDKQVTLTARRQYPQRVAQRGGDVVRLLPGNLGYVDLDRLASADVDAMFEKLGNTRAIIFDMRGYPRGAGWDIAPRLNVNGASFYALIARPIVTAQSDGSERVVEQQQLEAGAGRVYRGKTFMLVDERAISQAEHTGIFLRAANGTRFVGSQTAGTDGETTLLVLPGGIQLHLTGMEVRYADGKPIERVGLVPDVEVKPTLAGIRAGRDEVLERAITEAGHGR
jgi:C-terminal processing protease CtpA/Prc